jgi:replicative DNA helicase
LEPQQQTFARLPPHSADAERSLLGAILLDGDVLTNILVLVKAEDFYATAHGKIYAACAQLFHDGKRVDAVLIKEELARRGELERVGGETYLAQLAAGVPSSAGAEDYARIVSERAVTRSLIHVCTSIQTAAFEGATPGHQLLDFAESQVFALSRGAAEAETVGIQTVLNETFDEIQALIEHGGAMTGLATGFLEFDEMTSGLGAGDLVIVAGRPSMGKTTFSNCIVDHVAVVEKKPVVYFSLEVNRKHLVRNMLCARARVELQRVRRGDLGDAEIEQLTRAAGELMDAPVFIDDSTNATAIELRAKARRIKKNHGLGLVVVGYLQLMETGGAENRQQEIAAISPRSWFPPCKPHSA